MELKIKGTMQYSANMSNVLPVSRFQWTYCGRTKKEVINTEVLYILSQYVHMQFIKHLIT